MLLGKVPSNEPATRIAPGASKVVIPELAERAGIGCKPNRTTAVKKVGVPNFMDISSTNLQSPERGRHARRSST
jgi:hypothetical protein